jgi:protein-tyrosine phosphatase
MPIKADYRKKILFVCTGNICRSPLAQGIFTEKVRLANLDDHFIIDSAGTHAWCEGNAPDSFAQAAAQSIGVDISKLRARKLASYDFDFFDLLLAADHYNTSCMYAECGKSNRHKIHLLMDFVPNRKIDEIPDPYGAGIQSFIEALELIEQACSLLLQELEKDIASARDK